MREATRAPERRFVNLNGLTLVVIVTIIAIGLLNLRNADFYSAETFHQRQIKWYLLGMVLAIAVSVTDLHIISRLAYVLYGLGVVLLLAVLFTDPINNSRRWLPFLGQPSEFMKIFAALALARLFHDQRQQHGQRPERHTLATLMKPFALLLPPVLLIFAEPDLGTAIIVMLIGLSIIFYEGVQWRSVLLALGVVLLVFPMAWKFALHGYHRDRFLVWWDLEKLEADRDTLVERVKAAKEEDKGALQQQLVTLKRRIAKGYQPKMAVEAVRSGQFYGRGGYQANENRQKALPYLHTDFVIATFGEERGFIGCTVLMILYYLLVYWCLRVARAARDKFQVLTAVGVGATIFWQFFVNVGMVTGLLPVVGVTLPLLSYGGSSVLTVCMGLGLLFNIALKRRVTS